MEEGIPVHLVPALEHWAEGVFGYRLSPTTNENLIHAAALAIRVPVAGRNAIEKMQDLLYKCRQDEDLYLDLLDYLLRCSTRGKGWWESLETSLSTGGSAWMATRERGLQRRVDETAQASFDDASSPADLASEELKQGWERAFSRDPDASDAWDHAIKAVEAVLIPIIAPKQDKAQLGHVVGSLKSQGERWKFVIPGPGMDNSIQPVLEILNVLWPNPDRHANKGRRKPTLAESQAVIHLAVTVVQWARSDSIQLR
ncbi:hypothetical protein [Streptomyces longispororuber]|uniref:hypothetical protein n=1 Tax=Streptomyces longispororuber TaxID=68230 RepID=UPI00210C4A5A|nr:hypothetical protein [Streptomyces longispororuber]MCQ4207835.1 hypothetical protein [Streptomyces longispororuber]